MKKTFYISIYFSLIISAFGQTNLVPNPSYEIHDTCPDNYGQIRFAKPWFQPSTGTPDFFHTCANPSTYVSIPGPTSGGYSFARTGNGMSVILISDYVLSSPSNKYREYLAVKLTNTLVNNQKYYVTYYVKLADSARYASNSISVYFSKDSISKNSFDTINAIPQVTNSPINFISSKSNWTKMKGNFIANGTEKYMYIGNFHPDVKNDTLFVGPYPRNKWTYNFQYYYVEDICVSTNSTFCENLFVGLNEFKSYSYNIYPNPATSYLEISFYNQVKSFITISNSFGVELYKNEFVNYHKLDLEYFPDGIYFLNIRQDYNTEKRKVIIRH